MLQLSHRLAFFYCFLLFTTLFPPCPVNGRAVFEAVNGSEFEKEEKSMVKQILEGTPIESVNEWPSIEGINCTWDGYNWTSSSFNGTNPCVNGTWDSNETDTNWNGTVVRKDRFKVVQIIPILIQAAVILVKVIKICIAIAKIIIKIGYWVFKTVGKVALKGIQLAIKAGKIVGKYVYKAGKLVLELYDVVEPMIDPIKDYYKQQEEAKRMAAEEEKFRQQEMEREKKNAKWDADNSEVPEGIGEEPEWEPKANPDILSNYYDDESDNMPGFLIAIIIITLVAFIVAMPTTAFIITNQVDVVRRRRRRRRGAKSKKTKKGESVSKKKSKSKSKSSKKKGKADKEAEPPTEAVETKVETEQE